MTSSVSTPTIQFSGLASGLDTSSIISSLMAVEAQPENMVKSRLATVQSQISAMRSINSTVAGLATSCDSFLTGSTWTQLTSKASNTAFAVTASSTATQATVNLQVTQSATGSAVILKDATPFSAGGTFTLTTDAGKTPSFTVAAGASMSDVAAAINAGSTTSGMRAVVIDPQGTPSLEIVNTATGAASNFTLTNDADPSTVLADSHTASAAAGTGSKGLDAQLTVDGVAMTSATNTITVMAGVQVTIPSGIDQTVPSTSQSSTISVSDDGSSRANALNTFVGQINSLLQTISQQTAYGVITAGSTASGAGALAGNPDLRDVATQLSSTIFATTKSASGVPISLANMGLSVDQDGNLTFDSAAFQSAYAADPAGVQAAFTGPDGFITRVKEVAYNASAPDNSNKLGSDGKPVLGTTVTGSISAAIDAMNAQVTQYNADIAAWDDRLAQKQASLQSIYTNLETSMSTLQSQQSWLTSALSSLDSGWAQND